MNIHWLNVAILVIVTTILVDQISGDQ